MNDMILMETVKITDSLVHSVFISKDEKIIRLGVDFLDGKFKIEKDFQNCLSGLSKLSVVRSNLDSEAKVFRYLRIGEQKNES
jgi:hypothetical protein